jgi:hypothetical protein
MSFKDTVKFLILTFNEKNRIGLIIDKIKLLGFNKTIDKNFTNDTTQIAKEK